MRQERKPHLRPSVAPAADSVDAEAFSAERITASHANLLARLPQNVQATAYEQCWRKDWQDKEAHLLPAKHLSAWIQTNLFLSLVDAPFDREDPTLNAIAGACVTCPRRSGFNTSLFHDVQDGDQCLDSPCYQTKVTAHLDRELASRPELIQIENGWRRASEQRPGAVQRGHFREIDTDNPDAEPPCEAAQTAIIVYGKRVGTTLTVCIDNHCPVHDPRAAARQAENPAPVLAPAPATETDGEAEARRQQNEQQRKDYDAEQERMAEQRRQEREREDQEYEQEQARREQQRKDRTATFEHILDNAPASLSNAQLRVLLSAIVNLDPYTFADDLAEELTPEGDTERRSAEEVLLAAIDTTADDKLIRFAIRLALSSHVRIPRENEPDFLTEANAVFTPQPQAKQKASRKATRPTLVSPTAKKASQGKKKIAA